MQLSLGWKQIAATLALSATAMAQDYVGLDANTSQIYTVSTTTNSATFLGAITGAPPFGFSNIAPLPGGGYLGVAPGAVSGYRIYRIDGQTLAATLLWTISTTQTAGVGCALSPLRDKLYVAGFVGLSFRVVLDSIDLNTGVRTPYGDIPAGWGLAFDSLGELYTSVQGATWPELVRIDLANPLLGSVNVGPMTGVDMNLGIDLGSDMGTGAIHAWSRQTTSIYSINETNAAATLVSLVSGASSLHTVKEVPCNSVRMYGAGCAGSGGFTPRFSVRGCAEINSTVTLQLTQCPGSASATFVFGTGQIAVPLGFGCDLLINPILPVSIGFTTSPGGPGAGTASFPVAIPWMPTGDVTMQALVIDGGTLLGLTVSNGVLFSF